MPPPGIAPPEHLARKILGSRDALAGERKLVTVLFADVMGSMDLAEQVDPEDWRRIMDRFFTILAEGVHRFDGTVDKFTGDGIMALFGAPVAHEDHARRACHAALHLAREIDAYAAELRRADGLSFSVRMGLNSGEVVVGSIGDDLHLHYTALGHTVGLAQRMEQLAAPGSAYLTATTASLVAGYFELRDLGRFQIKGVGEPVETYELAGAGRARSRLDVARARGFSRFVGRETEMAVLQEALARASEGSAQIVAVVGEPGVGKSRLCHEFAERCRAQAVEIYSAAAISHGSQVPLLPVLELLRGYFGVTERDSDRVVREKVAGRLLLLDESFKDVLPLVFDFLGVPDPDRPARVDPQARQRSLQEFLTRLVHTGARQMAVVIVLEDLHWIDDASAAFLAHLVDILPGTRTLLVVNYRPEYRAPWMSAACYRELPLTALGSDATGEMLRDLLGAEPALAELRDGIAQRSGGNPFYIEEMVQSLVEDGALVGDHGGYHLTRPVEELTLPATVQAVLAARIDRLPERDKEILQTAAVIGREFAEPVLRRVAEAEPEALAEALGALADADLVREQALGVEAEYAFKHPLTQEVAYRSQLAERRAAVHRAVAAAVEDLYPERVDERAALVAHHWEQAGDATLAARWSARAALWTGSRNPISAVSHWQKARLLLRAAPETPETIGLGIAASSQILLNAFRVGMATEEAEERFAEGKALAERGGNQHGLAMLLSAYGAARGFAGDGTVGARYAAEASALAWQLGDPELIVATGIGHAFFESLTGTMPAALELTDRLLEITRGDLALGTQLFGFSGHIYLLWFRGGILLMNLGRREDARPELDRALSLAREQGEVELLGWGEMSKSWHCTLDNDLTGALAHARRSVELSERLGSPFSRALSHWGLARAHVAREEWDSGVAAFERALEIGRTGQTALYAEGAWLSDLAEALAGRGDHERARATADEGVEIAVRSGITFYEGLARLMRARVLRVVDGAAGVEEARAEIEAARAIFVRSKADLCFPQMHAELAEIAAVAGDVREREHHLREAVRLFTACGLSTARLREQLEQAAA